MCPRDQRVLWHLENIFSSEATSLSILVAIDLVETKIYINGFGPSP